MSTWTAPHTAAEPATWLDDWLTPADRKVARQDAARVHTITTLPPAPVTTRAQTAAKLVKTVSDRRRRIRARRVQRVAQALAYAAIGTLTAYGIWGAVWLVAYVFGP